VIDNSGAYRASHYDVEAGDADFAVVALKDADSSKPVLNDATTGSSSRSTPTRNP
jgi:hypothetical protein